jgi:crotonobetainyl-CoA:carnitine CoA-transferase CaiB-like acyl-CoA transferase
MSHSSPHRTAEDARPLAGFLVLERSRAPAAAYAGRLLATLGAEVILIEPRSGSVLRNAEPLIVGTNESALFAYLSAGKRSVALDLDDKQDRAQLRHWIERAQLVIDDTPLEERAPSPISEKAVAAVNPGAHFVSVLPFGAYGEQSSWRGEEINLIHASGEGYLLPNGYARALYPDRAPLRIYGPFAHYQAGCVAALSAMAALWSPCDEGQFVDVSVQDSALLCGAFALQRLGDGSLEHREGRSFRYGGVFETRTGFVQLLTLEDRQWHGLVTLLGNPGWSQDPALNDGITRSQRGDEINQQIRLWMSDQDADDIVARAQQLNVPLARYRTPFEVLSGEHEQSRGLFAPTQLQSGQMIPMLIAPYLFAETPLHTGCSVPALGSANVESTP